jgi:acyl-CoA thioesterase-1
MLRIETKPTRRALLRYGVAAHCSVWLPAWAQPTAAPVLLVVGDSLSAEYGLARGTGWVALLEQRLRDEKIAARVVNASISGDTTSSGRSRLPALLKSHQPRWVIVELGGNDALRGLPLAMTGDNLSAMLRDAKAAGASALLLGMQLPPNYGKRYGEDFAAMYQRVATAERSALVPFLLKGIADQADVERWFQPDRIHPRAEAQAVMLDNVWPALRPLLR